MKGGGLEPLSPLLIEPIVRAALVEDLGLAGDITSEATVPANKRVLASLVSRENGVLAGLDCALLAFRLLDPQVKIDVGVHDGSHVQPGTHVAAFAGDARALLAAERTALNLVHQAAEIFNGMEHQAREIEARAQSLCRCWVSFWWRISRTATRYRTSSAA